MLLTIIVKKMTVRTVLANRNDIGSSGMKLKPNLKIKTRARIENKNGSKNKK